MREYRSELCKSCYYKNSADESIRLNKLGRLFESEIIKPCDVCDGELYWIDKNCNVYKEFKEDA